MKNQPTRTSHTIPGDHRFFKHTRASTFANTEIVSWEESTGGQRQDKERFMSWTEFWSTVPLPLSLMSAASGVYTREEKEYERP